MSRTFGEDLELFAEAVRTIRQPDFEAILRTVKDYLSSSLSVSKIEVVRRQSRGHDLVLVPVIDKSDPYGAYGLFDREGRPNGQNAFSYIKQRNLWIISSGEEETLAKSKIYVDQWSDSHADEIPTFVRFEENKRHRGDERTRTLICVPVYKKNITAVVYYESKEEA
jgi:hypothetical protein